jgi:hypothetical protein
VSEFPSQDVHTFLVRRKEYFVHAAILPLHAPMVANSVRLIEHMDRQFERAFYLLAETATGETVEEQVKITHTYTFPVFSTWWDHLKYDLKNGRIWISRFIPARLRKKLSVSYMNINKSVDYYQPTKVVRACPHIDSTFNDKPEMHLRYLFPIRWEELDRGGRSLGEAF